MNLQEMSYREALRQAMREEMQRDETVWLLGEDIGEYGGSFKVTLGLQKEFGEARVRETPISESSKGLRFSTETNPARIRHHQLIGCGTGLFQSGSRMAAFSAWISRLRRN